MKAGSPRSVATEAPRPSPSAAGVTTPRFDNVNTITTGVSSTLANSDATGINIAAGANLPILFNNGAILTTAGGGISNVNAIRDLSGTLTTINNAGSIQALLIPNEANDPLTGTVSAIDVSANTTGVTYRQYGETSAATASDPDTDGDGVTDSNEPLLLGAIRFGSGADTLNLENGIADRRDLVRRGRGPSEHHGRRHPDRRDHRHRRPPGHQHHQRHARRAPADPHHADQPERRRGRRPDRTARPGDDHERRLPR